MKNDKLARRSFSGGGLCATSAAPARELTRPQAGSAAMRRLVVFAFACLAAAARLCAQSSSGAAAPPHSETTFLELAKPVGRELRGGEKHSYKLHAEAGQF